MSQTPGERPGQPTTAHAEELLDSLGRRIGLFTAQTGQRIQNVAASLGDRANRVEQPNTVPGEKVHSPTRARAEEQEKLAMERAEVLVDRVGQRLGHFFAATGLHIQRTVARIREEVEDIEAEAQHIRKNRARPPQ
ncbi:MAG: hypothetical protein JO183_10620 [Ktedonobacteraceae bacterium]|nr:hypothetical protein [Ktedonobacteraceae bacterium]MBV9020784.1 hypothetical protein [Ktedonobacteraceae bacterium]